MERSFRIKAQLTEARARKRLGSQEAGHVQRHGASRNGPVAWGVHDPSSTFSDFDASSSAAGGSVAGAAAAMSRVSTRPSGSISTGTSSIWQSSRIRSMTLRSRIWVASESVPPSFSTRDADPANALAGPRGHRLDLERQVVVLDLDPLGVGDLGKQQQLFQAPQGRLVGVGANLGFVGTDVVVRHALPLQLHDQPADRALLLAGNQIRGKLERRLDAAIGRGSGGASPGAARSGCGVRGSRARPREDDSALSTSIESRNA